MSKPIVCECGRKVFVMLPAKGRPRSKRRKHSRFKGKAKGHTLCFQCYHAQNDRVRTH